MIRSFSNEATAKIFYGEELTRKEARKLGSLDIIKAKEVLAILDNVEERHLLTPEFKRFHYHSLKGSPRYSLDVNGRRSKWRATFQWENEDKIHVELVLIEDTHS